MHDAVIAVLNKQKGAYLPEVLATLTHLEPMTRTRMVRVEDLDVGMIIVHEVRDKYGRRLVSHGQEVTYPLLTKLFNLAQKAGYVQEPICVVVSKP